MLVDMTGMFPYTITLGGSPSARGDSADISSSSNGENANNFRGHVSTSQAHRGATCSQAGWIIPAPIQFRCLGCACNTELPSPSDTRQEQFSPTLQLLLRQGHSCLACYLPACLHWSLRRLHVYPPKPPECHLCGSCGPYTPTRSHWRTHGALHGCIMRSMTFAKAR